MGKWGIGGSVLLAAALALAVPSTVGATGTVAPAPAIAKPAAAPPAPNLALAHIKAVRIATGLSSPVAFAWRTGDLGRVYVAEQPGKVVIVAAGKIVSTVLSLTGLSHGNEEGLLGIVFSADGTKLYVDYTDTTGDIHIVEFTMNGNVANPATRRQLLVIPHHTFPNHNGGNLVMGTDHLLYIGVGDGGGAGDTLHNAQNLGQPLGKILRIDPRPSGSLQYTIPASNPFVGKPGDRGEIWMYGLRNPWRFSFDRTTNDLWIGDVGQALYEEIDYAPAGQQGINWGWNLREGLHAYNGGAKPPGERDPIFERPHSQGDCAIIGGYVYRGAGITNFNGAYIFGDECTGELRAIVQSGGKEVQSKDMLVNIPQITSFGQGPAGGLYAASRAGSLYVLEQG